MTRTTNLRISTTPSHRYNFQHIFTSIFLHYHLKYDTLLSIMGEYVYRFNDTTNVAPMMFFLHMFHTFFLQLFPFFFERHIRYDKSKGHGDQTEIPTNIINGLGVRQKIE